ncbi:MAG: DEAD/DEAH box helicase, partial [Polyangiales bacterium]
MSELLRLEQAPAGLGAALRNAGFESFTAIQQAVLDPELVDRDLRISSQTGSGKTVALGLL